MVKLTLAAFGVTKDGECLFHADVQMRHFGVLLNRGLNLGPVSWLAK